jgi:hypothetical protein
VTRYENLDSVHFKDTLTLHKTAKFTCVSEKGAYGMTVPTGIVYSRSVLPSDQQLIDQQVGFGPKR